MAFELKCLSDELVYIRWNRMPSKEDRVRYIADLRRLLDQAPHPLYFISDLRRGHLNDAFTIQELSRLASHPNWGGGTAFASGEISQPVKGIFVGLFVSLSQDKSRTGQMAGSLDEALEYLEEVKPGVTKSVDWKAVLELFA